MNFTSLLLFNFRTHFKVLSIYQEQFPRLVVAGNQFTLLQSAVEEGHLEIIKTVNKFLKKQPKVISHAWLLKDAEGRNLLSMVVSQGQSFETVKGVWDTTRNLMETQRRNLLIEVDKSNRNAFQTAAMRNFDANVLEFLWSLSEKSSKFLIKTDKTHSSVLHLAAAENLSTVIGKIWEIAEKILDKHELKKFYKTRNGDGKTALSVAITNAEGITCLMRIGRKLLPEDFQDFLIDKTDKTGCSIFQDIAACGSEEVFKIICSEMYKMSPYDKRKCLLHKDKLGRSVLMLILIHNEGDEIEKLGRTLSFCRRSFDPKAWKKLLFATDNDKRNLFSFAIAKNTDPMVLSDLWRMLQGYLTRDELIKLLKSFDSVKNTESQVGEEGEITKIVVDRRSENTPLHLVVLFGTVESLEFVILLVKEFLPLAEQKSLLMKRGQSKRTPLSIAAAMDPDKNMISTIWEFGKEILNNYELMKLLGKCDESGCNAFELAATFNTKEILETVWSFVQELYPDTVSDHLMRNDKFGRNILHKALVVNEQPENIEYLWELAQQHLNKKLIVDFLTARDVEGNTALIRATPQPGEEKSQSLEVYENIVAQNLNLRQQRMLSVNIKEEVKTCWVMLALLNFFNQ